MADAWLEGMHEGREMGRGLSDAFFRGRELKERMKERHDAIDVAAQEKHHQLNKEAAEASRQTEQDYEKKTEKEDSLAERKREFDLLMPSKNEVAHARAVAAANKPGSDDVKSAISLADKYTKMMADPLLSRKMTPAQISQMNGAFNTLAKHASSTMLPPEKTEKPAAAEPGYADKLLKAFGLKSSDATPPPGGWNWEEHQ